MLYTVHYNILYTIYTVYYILYSVDYVLYTIYCRYADRAKKIKNNAVVNENPIDKLIRELKASLSFFSNFKVL